MSTRVEVARSAQITPVTADDEEADDALIVASADDAVF
jgi:hypothetical protein